MPFITNPACLDDCYPPDHCLSHLIEDYKAAGGICKGSFLDTHYNNNGIWNISDKPCELYEEGDDYYYDNYYGIKTGLCSEKTEMLLLDQKNCVHPLYSQKYEILLTIDSLIYSLCTEQVYWGFWPEPLTTDESEVKLENKNNKLNPIDFVEVINGVKFNTTLEYENAKHRYPWLCSLRRRGEEREERGGISSHLCAVTLLSRPPGPTVLVTSAHCTYICKSQEGNIVPNCCCPNVGPDICTESQDCGTNAKTLEMTGADVEVLCGEWDTATEEEEEYNVILAVEKITRHPGFNISRGEANSQFVSDDIATVHVLDDDNFAEKSDLHKIYPACLPTQPLSSTTAVHSGWSTPPPRDFVETNVPAYSEVYHQFSKQWHYGMDIVTCRDPLNNFYSGAPLNYATNSYYPPGTVCATEISNTFCPTSGESGSPRMVRDDQSRYIISGLKSFIKGRVKKNA